MQHDYETDKSTTDLIRPATQGTEDFELTEDLKGKLHSAAQNHPLSDEQAARRLKLFRQSAQYDPNIAIEDIDNVDNALERHDVDKENDLIHGLVEDSPYPEVSIPTSDTSREYHQTNSSTSRYAQPSKTTMSTFLPILFEPG